MLLSQAWKLEQLFDSANLQELAKFEDSRVSQLLLMASQNNWRNVIQLAEEIFQTSDSQILSGFALQFGIAATEEIYDLSLRQIWLDRWNQINDWASEPWLQYLRLFHHALTFFFSGEILTARSYFERCLHQSEEMKYERGKMRSLFHLGLIEAELGRSDLAQMTFHKVELIARNQSATRMLNRVSKELKPFQSTKNQFEILIETKNYKKARKFLLNLEKQRRLEGRTRERESLTYYWAILAFAFNKNKLAQICLQKIRDPIIRENLFAMKERFFGLTQHEQNERVWLINCLGRHIQTQTNELSLLGVDINNLQDQDVAHFIRLIISNPSGLTKEKIVQSLWKYDYDPITHDNRIYKLVLKARQIIGKKDWLINTYGQYRLNPKLVS